MKRAILGIVAIAALAVAVVLRAQQESKKTSGSHLGTWQPGPEATFFRLKRLLDIRYLKSGLPGPHLFG